jgi:uncharacterized DUF497 family protein
MNVACSALKNKINKSKHGLSLSRAKNFDMDTARLALDDREDYGEERWVASVSSMHDCIYSSSPLPNRHLRHQPAQNREI